MPYSTSEVADMYRVSSRRMTQIARDRGIKPRLLGSTFMWTTKQVLLARPGRPGRPRKGR